MSGRGAAGAGFLAAAPPLQRGGLRVLLALATRPRGRRLLVLAPAAEQLARSTLGLLRYDAPGVAAPLGWDARAVAERGRALRAGRR